MRKLILLAMVVLLAGVLFAVGYFSYQNGQHAGHEEMAKWYADTYYTNCKTARTWQMTDWDVDCEDGYTYERIEPESQQEKQKREADAKAQYEQAKAKWLAENPPVKQLFPEGKEYDTDFVIQYLRENPIAGHCALVWRPDVVCAEWGGIKFPYTRESL